MRTTRAGHFATVDDETARCRCGWTAFVVGSGAAVERLAHLHDGRTVLVDGRYQDTDGAPVSRATRLGLTEVTHDETAESNRPE